MKISYENCPWCHGKKIVYSEQVNTVIIRCLECDNIIDRFPKEEPREPNLGI